MKNLARGAGIMWTAILGQASASEQAVKVSLGVSSSRLNALEKWTDQNAPNWTVVLMVNARQESFSEAGGRTHHGIATPGDDSQP